MLFLQLKGAGRYLRMRLLRREVVLRGSCRMCGRCCSEIALYSDGWVRSLEDFQKAREEIPGFDRLEPMGKDDYGNLTVRCTWLTEDGLCRDHENRLSMCRGHPNRWHYLSGADLAGYCGFRFEEIPSFERVLRKRLRAERKKKTGSSGSPRGVDAVARMRREDETTE